MWLTLPHLACRLNEIISSFLNEMPVEPLASSTIAVEETRGLVQVLQQAAVPAEVFLPKTLHEEQDTVVQFFQHVITRHPASSGQ